MEPVKEHDWVIGKYVLIPSGGYADWHAKNQKEPLYMDFFNTAQEAESSRDRMTYGEARNLRVARVKIVEY